MPATRGCTFYNSRSVRQPLLEPQKRGCTPWDVSLWNALVVLQKRVALSGAVLSYFQQMCSELFLSLSRGVLLWNSAPCTSALRRTLCFYFHGVLLTHLEEAQHRTWLLSLLALIWIASSYCIPTAQTLIFSLSSQGTWEKQCLYIVTLYVEDNYYFLLLSVKWEERGIAKYISVVSLV